MSFDLYSVVYIIGNLVDSYVIYKFLRVFYKECKTSQNLEFASYIGYFIVVTLIHTIIQIPIAVALSNLVMIFLLTLLYEGNFKKSSLSVLLIFVFLLCVETGVAYMTNFLNLDMLSPYNYHSAFGIVVMRVSSLILALLIGNFKNVKNNKEGPPSYWLSLFIIPVGTLFLLFSVFAGGGIPDYMVGACIIFVFIINIFTFYLYDSLSRMMAEEMDQRLTKQQNRYYENQLELMKESLAGMKILRHDIRNKLSPLYQMALSQDYERLTKGLEDLTSGCFCSKEYSSSGNTAIDSIVNFKLNQASKDDIDISSEIVIPPDLSLSPFDISVILGNLLDNAIEGAKSVSENRWIDIIIKYTKGRLIITIANSYDGLIVKSNDTILTRKDDKENHGFGIKSIEKTISAYNGAMNIDYTTDCFKVKTLLYI